MKNTYLPVKMEQTQCSETSAHKIQTLGNYPEESTEHVVDTLTEKKLVSEWINYVLPIFLFPAHAYA